MSSTRDVVKGCREIVNGLTGKALFYAFVIFFVIPLMVKSDPGRLWLCEMPMVNLAARTIGLDCSSSSSAMAATKALQAFQDIDATF